MSPIDPQHGRWLATKNCDRLAHAARPDVDGVAEKQLVDPLRMGRHLHERFSMALKGRTPVERLADFAIAA
jgi:hypothetical protein